MAPGPPLWTLNGNGGTWEVLQGRDAVAGEFLHREVCEYCLEQRMGVCLDPIVRGLDAHFSSSLW